MLNYNVGNDFNENLLLFIIFDSLFLLFIVRLTFNIWIFFVPVSITKIIRIIHTIQSKIFILYYSVFAVGCVRVHDNRKLRKHSSPLFEWWKCNLWGDTICIEDSHSYPCSVCLSSSVQFDQGETYRKFISLFFFLCLLPKRIYPTFMRESVTWNFCHVILLLILFDWMLLYLLFPLTPRCTFKSPQFTYQSSKSATSCQ